jgi:glycosyltransferase involved in cell wall biosynthesis
MPAPKRVAIIHYWLIGMRGGERVLERLIGMFPEADIFTHVYDPTAISALIRSRPIKTSFIQKLPGARTHYQKYLPLMPMALEQFDLRGYDLVISSESGPAKGVIAAPDAMHLCYCHSPMRYLWDLYPDYRASAGWLTAMLMPWMFHHLRMWDVSAASRVDRFVANSTFIQRRISRVWGRQSVIVHPPVDIAIFTKADIIEERFLWVGQMTQYKRADIVVEAFNQLGLPLLMVGEGEMAAQLARTANGNIIIVPRLDYADLRAAYARCRALIFTAREDFGIVPVEAMASGRPVLAFGSGGALDSVTPGVSGLFFEEQTVESLIEGVRAMEAWLPHFDPDEAVRSAGRFAPEHFEAGIRRALAN